MRVFLITVLLLITGYTAICQGAVAGSSVVVQGVPSRMMYLRDAFSSAVAAKPTSGNEGSPFLNDEWMLATLVLQGNRILDSVYIKLNLYNRKLHFRNEFGLEMEATERIEEIRVIDPASPWYQQVFRTGYEGDKNAFFQVLADGPKIQLVKKRMIVLWETKVLGAEDKKTFQPDDDIFFTAKAILYKPDKKCSSLRLNNVFQADQEKMLRYISDNNLQCNKAEDMMKLVKYYNSF